LIPSNVRKRFVETWLGTGKCILMVFGKLGSGNDLGERVVQWLLGGSDSDTSVSLIDLADARAVGSLQWNKQVCCFLGGQWATRKPLLRGLGMWRPWRSLQKVRRIQPYWTWWAAVPQSAGEQRCRSFG